MSVKLMGNFVKDIFNNELARSLKFQLRIIHQIRRTRIQMLIQKLILMKRTVKKREINKIYDLEPHVKTGGMYRIENSKENV